MSLVLTTPTNPGVAAWTDATALPQIISFLFPMDAVGGGTVIKVGWVPIACVLTAVNVYMTPVNTQGTFVLNWINLHAGFGGSFDMNSLPMATVTSVPLPAAGDPSLVFDPALSAGRWDITLQSDNAAYDGDDVNIELIFGS